MKHGEITCEDSVSKALEQSTRSVSSDDLRLKIPWNTKNQERPVTSSGQRVLAASDKTRISPEPSAVLPIIPFHSIDNSACDGTNIRNTEPTLASPKNMYSFSKPSTPRNIEQLRPQVQMLSSHIGEQIKPKQSTKESEDSLSTLPEFDDFARLCKDKLVQKEQALVDATQQLQTLEHLTTSQNGEIEEYQKRIEELTDLGTFLISRYTHIDQR